MVLGLVGAVVLANGSVLKAFAMIILGLLLGIIGADVNSGTFRFDFGIAELQDGIDFVAISMGLFGFTEIIVNLSKGETRDPITEKVGSIWPSRKELWQSRACHHARHFAGFLPRILPGAELCSLPLLLIRLRRKSAAKTPIPPFGKGNIAGVAGPESANQRRRPDELHSDAHARHSLQRYDGFDDRRADDSQHHAGTSGHEL